MFAFATFPATSYFSGEVNPRPLACLAPFLKLKRRLFVNDQISNFGSSNGKAVHVKEKGVAKQSEAKKRFVDRSDVFIWSWYDILILPFEFKRSRWSDISLEENRSNKLVDAEEKAVRLGPP